jgi:ABC-type multidrug transport system fused ATPase/permease subunit
VGERGITLSGGQKVRLSLARALYSDADIYLLDDPISAVDSKVARKIYENTLLYMKRKKTIILVTHQISYLNECDKVVIMEEGRAIRFDHPQTLRNKLNEL